MGMVLQLSLTRSLNQNEGPILTTLFSFEPESAEPSRRLVTFSKLHIFYHLYILIENTIKKKQ